MGKRILIHVILPVKLAWEPTYVTDDESVRVGTRVRVKLAGKELSGVVSETGVKLEISIDKVHPIVCVEKDLDPVTENEIRFWRFLSGYYMCSIGEVFKAAYPLNRVETEKKKARKTIAYTPKERNTTINECILDDHSLLHCPDAEKESEILSSNIRETLQEQKGHVLFLVPDKFRFKDWEKRLSAEFSDRLLTYSHEVSPATKREIARSVRGNSFKVILGLRSAIFLPFSSLSLVIVSDEHDASYKQSRPAPRYNGRDAAIVLAKQFGAKVILSSATPSLESLHNCSIGKFTLTEIPCSKAPVTIIDTSAEKRKNGMDGEVSKLALSMMARAEAQGRKVITVCPADINKAKFSPDCLTVFNMADIMLKKNDFRADERALQTIDYLRYNCSELVIHTTLGTHPVFSMEGPSTLLDERRQFKLPPFGRMIRIGVRCANAVRQASLEESLAAALGGSLDIILPSDSSIKQSKEDILKKIRQFEKQSGRGASVTIDVDPV